jgi:hydroxyquinol 1,2-dioxygenase
VNAPRAGHGDGAGHDSGGEPCYVVGRVRARDGTPIAGAEVQVRPSDGNEILDARPDGAPESRAQGILVSGADGRFRCKAVVAAPCPIPHDGPVGRMLQSLGRHPWRPAHLHFMITAPGYQRLVTHVFRKGDRYLDADAVFGVRSSLVADWGQHASGPTPDGQTRAAPFTTLEFEFVLNTTTGDKT